jgi:hypothetical protein
MRLRLQLNLRLHLRLHLRLLQQVAEPEENVIHEDFKSNFI